MLEAAGDGELDCPDSGLLQSGKMNAYEVRAVSEAMRSVSSRDLGQLAIDMDFPDLILRGAPVHGQWIRISSVIDIQLESRARKAADQRIDTTTPLKPCSWRRHDSERGIGGELDPVSRDLGQVGRGLGACK